ncbi:MAG: altronate dehydratase [Clostridia bacterium]|nr:altronate dehydratase [Clostridia bacterium]
MKDLIILTPSDNVGVLKAARGDVPMGHKIALTEIKKGEPVIKYGYPIGVATEDISAGSFVHTHNLASALTAEALDYVYEKSLVPLPEKPARNTVSAYKRPCGAGARNELYIVPTVGCIVNAAETICRIFKEKHANDLMVDDVIVLTHRVGCSELGDDYERTKNILINLSKNANVGGALFLGLGCEENQMDGIRALVPDGERVRFLVAQEVEDEVSEGLRLLEELYAVASQDKREEVSLSELTFGVKCGGSDGFSGITANYLIGRVADLLEACGATVVLAETPEVFGAEITLMQRAKDRKVFEDIAALVNKWKEFYGSHGVNVYENPSPGNKKGGITTLEEKSLGCVQKSGKGEVKSVLSELERATEHGLNVIESPGNDIIACTTLAAAGCNVILFSTGRGTPLGSVVPTVKIASNSPMAEKKTAWIDFDAGVTLFGKSMDEATMDLYNALLDVVEGKETSNERRGDKQIAIMKTGVTL